MKVVWLLMLSAGAAIAQPEPGSLYREYRVVMKGNEWRVTDPQAGHKGAAEFLPNPQIRFTIDDLENAVSAEAVLDRWGGHPGTAGQKIRFNGKAWLDVSSLTTTPKGAAPECFMWQDNPVIEVPLSHLREGANTLEGAAGDQVCYSFRWGQWGQSSAIIRVYYDSRKSHTKGRIASPKSGETLGENPKLRVDTERPESADRVDFVAWYEGYDENGDGSFRDWHHAYFYNRRERATAEDPRISGHAGTARTTPFETEWDTRWVPDQPSGSVKIVARIRDRNGVWFVTDPVEGLGVARPGVQVKLYKPENVPERYWVRAGRRASSAVTIPADAPLSSVVEAAVHVRTWNGHGEKLAFNGWEAEIGGGDHVYAYTVVQVPREKLRAGANVIEFHSATEHHGVEILWPGPALVVRYGK